MHIQAEKQAKPHRIKPELFHNRHEDWHRQQRDQALGDARSAKQGSHQHKHQNRDKDKTPGKCVDELWRDKGHADTWLSSFRPSERRLTFSAMAC